MRKWEKSLDANAKLKLKANHVQSRRAIYFRDWQEVLVAASDGTFARDIRLTQSVDITSCAPMEPIAHPSANVLVILAIQAF
jgi:predicted Zn-dependent protease